MSDPLALALAAKGIPQYAIDLVVERAAILQFDAGKSRWKAGIEAQVMHLGEIIIKGEA